ncbi:RNA polymerase sigma factor [Nannocystis pusilla]|uniref:RNA polymerase sigma factor n=1 Tax=Nannocystis pusilla TaxID=889268 RepID=UPI003B784A52
MSRETDRIRHELLALRCRRGARRAGRAGARVEPRLFFYVRRMLVDEEEAWQVMQEVWVAVLSRIDRLREPQCLPQWLYTIARNTLMTHLRGRYAERERAGGEAPEPVDEDDPLGRWADAEQVYAGLARLPPVDREVLTLCFLDDLSIAEIAEVLSIPPGTVKSRLFKARGPAGRAGRSWVMADRSDRFSDSLLELEQAHTTATLRERHRRQMEAMLVRPLSPLQRVLHAAVATAGLAGAGVCAALVVTEPDTLPPLTRAVLTLLAGFGASWSLWAAGCCGAGRCIAAAIAGRRRGWPSASRWPPWR